MHSKEEVRAEASSSWTKKKKKLNFKLNVLFWAFNHTMDPSCTFLNHSPPCSKQGIQIKGKGKITTLPLGQWNLAFWFCCSVRDKHEKEEGICFLMLHKETRLLKWVCIQSESSQAASAILEMSLTDVLSISNWEISVGQREKKKCLFMHYLRIPKWY